MKKLICLALSIVCLLSCGMTTIASAAQPLESDNAIQPLASDGAPIYGASYSDLTDYFDVTSYGYINNWNNFTYYYTDDFNEYNNGNNCGPTQVANLLSYYKSVGYIYAYPGNSITQSYYTNSICPALGYSASGSISLNDAADGFETLFESGASYYSTTVSNKPFLSWNDFKSLINSNKPLLVGYQGHLYLVIGYQTRGGVNYYVAITAFSQTYQRYALIGYTTTNLNRKAVTIN